MLFMKSREIVGIDIGSSSVKLVQLSEQKGTYSLKNAGILPLPSDAIVDNSLMDTTSIVETIRGLVKSLGSKAVDAACSISGNSVIIRKISLPAMTPEELEEQIAWEAEQYIPFDINDVNLDFEILDSDLSASGKMTVLLVASKKEIINEYVSVFNEAGLKLVVVDVDSFAVQNIFELNYEPSENDVVALINIGASIMNLNVVKGGISLFTRDVQMGGNLYTEEIQRQFAVSSQDAEHIKITSDFPDKARLTDIMSRVNETLSLEIHRSLDFYNSTAEDQKIAKVYLSGGCAKVAKLADAVSQRLGMPVELLNPLQKILCNEKEFDPEYLQEISPFIAVAAGLAMRRLGDK
ncbi:MAG: type IV pilus assembly protein PilM [Deltaproteobacteria bacterium]|nr:type IV pilus assembly protein PilM [Deltaproteobacteria bacterium]